MQIVFDLDNVIANTAQLNRALAFREEGWLIHPEEVTDWFYETDEGFSVLKTYQRYTHKEENIILAAPLDGAVKTVRKFNNMKNCEVSIATARPPMLRGVTESWLYLHDIQYKYLVFAHRKSVVDGTILVDDYDMNVVDWLESDPNRRAILYPAPWNLKAHQRLLSEYAYRLHIPRVADIFDHSSIWESIDHTIKNLINTLDLRPAWLQLSF